jgi:hypothetical protein
MNGPSRWQERMITFRPVMVGIAATAITLMISACGGRRYDPAMATRPYPDQLGQSEIIQAQVFRKGPNVTIVNASPQGFKDADLWLNRRYMYHLDSLKPGQTITLSLTEFFDAWGETPIAGGFFRTEEPTPSVLMQIQADQESPMVGMVTILPQDEF